MIEGKLPVELLETLVFRHINIKNQDVLAGPAIGMDCGAIRLKENLLVFTSDPITAAEKGAGKLAVHVNCNDIATTGMEPKAILVTLLAPLGTTPEEISELARELSEEADRIGVDIIGGHTEITSAVNRVVLSVTAVGYGAYEANRRRTPKEGDYVVVTKVAGLEGTAILCEDKEMELSKVLTSEELNQGKEYSKWLSVLPEGRVANAQGAVFMHDVTEGGLYGALWELAHGFHLGIHVYEKNIPITELTKKICVYYNVDPLRLISSGTMVIICENGEKMVEELEKAGIKASSIGYLKKEGYHVEYKDGTVGVLTPPESDELFKVI